nr:exocyst complex component EXO70B1-like [Ipomoea batatas]
MPFPVFGSYVLSVTSSNGVSFGPATDGLGVVLIFKISGRGIMEPDAPIPLETLTLVPSSKNGHHLTTYLMDYLMRMVSGYSKCEWIVARNIDDILWIGDTFSGKTSHVHHCGDQQPLASHIKLVIANLLCNLRW